MAVADAKRAEEQRMLRDTRLWLGVAVADAKRAEEQRMLRDTRLWLDSGQLRDCPHPATGASALHVAAAKGYIEVMRLLLAAAAGGCVLGGFWGDLGGFWVSPVPPQGQRPCDLADEETLPLLEELQRRQLHVRPQHAQKLPKNTQNYLKNSPKIHRDGPKIHRNTPKYTETAPKSPQNAQKNPHLCPNPPRPFQPPARDEESESQRKARSRLMRQARRATQVIPKTPKFTPPARDEESESQRKARSRLMRQARRATQPPARDEESESQRKARSRLMRQARRATQ
ncbi:protein phosphatase 1 regulatory subunit 12C-like, partial [Passer montanus]|uniref:protein phosphatase 1 regulatory subunit 12C-like n=1 Tax=Passer montanus TaxID=9160 RepID=UPI00195F52BC